MTSVLTKAAMCLGVLLFNYYNALAHERQVIFTETYVLVPSDDIMIAKYDQFDIELFRSKLLTHNGYKMRIGLMLEDGIGDFVTISAHGEELFTVYGDFKTEQIRLIYSSYKDAISPSGVRVGDYISEKVSKNLICSFELDDYCVDPDISTIHYYASDFFNNKECKQPTTEDYEHYTLYNCGKIEAISLANDKFTN